MTRRKTQAASAPTEKKVEAASDPLAPFNPMVREWFTASFSAATSAQALGWPAIASGASTLIFAPTGSGKTLTAFLWCIDRLMFEPVPEKKRRCRVLYISPLKALAVDVERNLRAPIAGISRVATAAGVAFNVPVAAVRTGDTPARERARFIREPADILITTPESLYLMLTSNARETLRSIDTVIIDEIHALVPTKRGAHLALSLERLEWLCERPPQRIGLSATQRPLDEVSHYLGGVEKKNRKPRKSDVTAEASATPEGIEHEFGTDEAVTFRPVTIVDTGERKKLSLRVEVPVENMAELGSEIEIPSGSAAQPVARASIWPAIHPRLLAHILEHQSTLVFVNSRRLAERLAQALNELAGEVLVHAHHGSIAREQRTEIEDQLKSGRIRGLVATSSLELGIDMGAVDLVIQIESPPSVASGLQRIGRGSHQVGAESSGVIFPKFRGDLVACAAVTRSMLTGAIEKTRYPRNPLDVLAQQIVAAVALDDWQVDDLYAALRCAAPFANLPRSLFDGVLDMLSGLYPSDEFAELRPRVTWDRISGKLSGREGSKRVAIVNGGTIPDRGLYGVYLAGAEKGAARVGELDEEMVFESRVGETFLLGASAWRIEEITHDRVVVSPAPGEPGKMPFWKGDSAERSFEFGQQIGQLVRELESSPPQVAAARLRAEHALDELAADNLLAYLREQREATGAVPDDRTVVIERCRDELGDWRVCVLTPFGGRIHSAWAMAAMAKVRNELALDVEAMWSDDGFVLRFPETDEPPDSKHLLPMRDEIERLVVQQLGSTALFAARFREIAARALLLPRRAPGRRAPLWQQRKRASDLLAVAARFGSFPMLLETYRECLRDVFDMPALIDLTRRIERREIRVTTVDSDRPSPFASSLLFKYVANYLYDGDAPLAERRAQALAIDQAQLAELLGETDLRELLDVRALEQTENELQLLDERYRGRNTDAIHDMLLRIGDLSREEIAVRTVGLDLDASLRELTRARRILEVRIGGEARFIAAEEAGRFRDALGVPLPTGIPERFLASQPQPLDSLVARYARTHAPFTTEDLASRFGIGRDPAEQILRRLAAAGRLVEGEFRPGGAQREWCDAEVLRVLRRRSLARLRREVEAVDRLTFARFAVAWQGAVVRRRGFNALLEAVESLQGYPIPASVLESEVLPARIEGYRRSDLDALASAGEIVWTGVEPLGDRDGRVALYLTDSLPLLIRDASPDPLSSLEARIVETLAARGASFFASIAADIGGFPAELADALWSLVWKGIVTNDTFLALRSYIRPPKESRRPRFRSRRTTPPGTEGRWALVPRGLRSPTERTAATAQQVLMRHGIVTRDLIGSEGLTGGFAAIYPVLRTMEEAGKLRRGYFVEGIPATQFTIPAAIDLLRASREPDSARQSLQLSAVDPANPYGVTLSWPAIEGATFTRSAGAKVILVDGRLGAYLSRGGKQLIVDLPDDEPDRSRVGSEVARILAAPVSAGQQRAILITEVNGRPTSDHPLRPYLEDHGFVATSFGHQLRGASAAHRAVEEPEPEDDEDA
jgi:ATP-dependent Lhr-like helicase